ncbi:MAG: hypothetical protein JG782_291 [Anaerophaga sp.]|jgi:hypothetical protein|nr:hypothetical protein [Anaerophaga sp.]MDI3520407.1 hypothetical protein [Anaerophaga sp.]MDK2840563.1 hypothetical protein [Anaerophaga sp.]MDN5290217.1 hypothetical protein [Anaerophaga sp.]
MLWSKKFPVPGVLSSNSESRKLYFNYLEHRVRWSVYQTNFRNKLKAISTKFITSAFCLSNFCQQQVILSNSNHKLTPI